MKTSAPQQRTPARPGAAARVRLLGNNEPVFAIDAHVARREGKILYLYCDSPLVTGTAVRIDIEGGLVLGEVSGSETSDADCLVAVTIDQVIPSVSELALLVSQVMSESRSRVQSPGTRVAS